MSKPSKEHDYIGLSLVSSAENIKKTLHFNEKTSKDMNLKATELRLGLPGSESPERIGNGIKDDEKYDGVNYLASGMKSMVAGSKRVFEAAAVKDVGDDKKLQSSPVAVQGTAASLASSKAQVVGWPPIRSFRKNSMAISAPKSNDNKDCKVESGCQFIKVSMDGAPYLRKIDLKTYGSYVGLSCALEKMFSGFSMGNQRFPHQDECSKGISIDTLHCSEYVLTYEDKDGDWMLVGDVPWNMFMDSCRRLRIMKSSEAVGLASRACGG